MVESKRVLVVTTSHGQIDEERPTGLWFEEFSVPYALFREEGQSVTVASPAGGPVPVDPESRPEGELSSADEAALEALEETVPLAEIDPGEFDAVFFPGGHGTMFDLAQERVGELVVSFADAGKPVAAVCHGPAAFVSARFEDGTPFVEGQRLTAFSDAEEREAELEDAMPFLLESRLRELGAKVDTVAPFGEHVVEDGDLITGQNPPSSAGTAKALLARLAGEGG